MLHRVPDTPGSNEMTVMIGDVVQVDVLLNDGWALGRKLKYSMWSHVELEVLQESDAIFETGEKKIFPVGFFCTPDGWTAVRYPTIRC